MRILHIDPDNPEHIEAGYHCSDSPDRDEDTKQTTAIDMISGAIYYSQNSKGKYEFVISQNRFSDITNSFLFSDITKSN